MSLLTPAEMESDFGGTGTHSAADLQMAIDLSEFDLGHAMNIFLEPTTSTEEYPWPYIDAGKMSLLHRRVTSLTTVTAKHSLDVDCVWIEDAECGVILDGLNGWIQIISNNLTLGNCNCATSIVPDRAVITYVSGFTATETAADTALGKALRMAITLRAREWLVVLEEGDAWEGFFVIESWSSMDYSERRKFTDILNPIGPGPMSQEAWRIINRIKEKPAIMLRSPSRI